MSHPSLSLYNPVIAPIPIISQGVVSSIDYENNSSKGDNWHNRKLDNTNNVKGVPGLDKMDDTVSRSQLRSERLS